MNKGARVYELNCDIVEWMFSKLDGRCGNAIKIMIVLLGTDDSKDSNLTLKKLAEKTGMSRKTVMPTLEVLMEKGMIDYEDNVVKLKTGGLKKR